MIGKLFPKSLFRIFYYEQTAAFAMIPSITAISRQFPHQTKTLGQLAEPGSKSKEKKEFVVCAKSMGYTDNQDRRNVVGRRVCSFVRWCCHY